MKIFKVLKLTRVANSSFQNSIFIIIFHLISNKIKTEPAMQTGASCFVLQELHFHYI